MVTDLQLLKQADGPHRPSPRILAVLVDSLPMGVEVRAVTINGQTGDVVFEVDYEGAADHRRFNIGECRTRAT